MSKVTPQDALIVINDLSKVSAAKSDDAFHFSAAAGDDRLATDETFALLPEDATPESEPIRDDEPAYDGAARGDFDDQGVSYDAFVFDI